MTVSPGSGGWQRVLMGGRARWFVAVAVAYYLGARLGLSLSLVEDNVTPLWPPTGIAVAAFVVLGRSLWPAVALAALAVNLPVSEGIVPALATAAGNTLAPLVAALVLERVGFRRQLDRQRDAIAIVLAALGSTVISATVGSLALAWSQAIPAPGLPAAWAVWWTGDAMGVLMVTPFLLGLALYRELPSWPLRQWAELVAVLLGVVLATTWAARTLQVIFLALPVVGWAAWRLQLRGAAPAALIASAITTWSATRAVGVFEGRTLLDQMLTLQAFNACIALTSFVLAALVSERNNAARALQQSATELEARVEVRTAELSALNAQLETEIRERFEAQEQLSQEEARAQREHDIAETLQRSLLPDRLPDVPGVEVAARYVPATRDVQIGGDWYDVLQLPGGQVGLAIGDVAGHGVSAAATMAQLRMALRVYALQDTSPSSVLRSVHRLVSQLPMPEMVTLLYAVLDPNTHLLRVASAGHPPALTADATGARFLKVGLAPPLGVTAEACYDESSHRLEAGATLLLYTDGLVERRGEPITDGLDRLSTAAAPMANESLEHLCDHLLTSLIEPHRLADDVALVAVRPLRVPSGPLRLTVPAEAQMLSHARGSLRRWLREAGVTPDEENDLLVACGEACANVVQHAYAAAPGVLELEARLEEGLVLLWVRDRGHWRAPSNRGGGWGLPLMQALTDTVDVARTGEGTVVHLQRRVSIENGGAR
ncbi:SpoIIE family protein phosphatase [Intrasporangium sp. DVR]|uniref:ATP-binding SpoIIE family protein phosphatase n=1 Tax=Intrasporangium sp. DVR TaxID=3127867 RepID=UPI00313A6CED